MAKTKRYVPKQPVTVYDRTDREAKRHAVGKLTKVQRRELKRESRLELEVKATVRNFRY